MSVVVGNSDFRPLPTNPNARITGVHESLLQECEKDIIWYRDNFFGKIHQNYLALDSPRGPLAISVIRDGDTYKALCRTTAGSERLSVSASSVSVSFFRKLLGLGPSTSQLMNAISRNIPTQNLKLCKEPNLPNELLAMEERQVIRSYKFGVAYVGPGQSSEEEMFSNKADDVSPSFKQFLNFLGETIELRGWKGYRAGLDVSGSNMTGTHSIYTKWQGYEIMFHVSTMLPFIPGDRQQLERKRHIGNDIVVIVFQDSDKPFQLGSVTSHQNHVVAVVQPCTIPSEEGGEREGYKFVVAPKAGVPAFTPDLPEPSVFAKDAVARDFFLHKHFHPVRTIMSSSEPQVISLVRSLVEIPSTTEEEFSCASYLSDYLRSRGWSIHQQYLEQPSDDSPKRFNIYAYRGDPDQVRNTVKVLLNSHLDTVPPYIPFREDDTNIYGRGSCDAKGSVAAQICAVEELLREGKIKEEDVGLLYVVSEETDHKGMMIANKLDLQCRYLLVGEPTELRVARGHKGIIKANIVVKGKAGHSGYPERGRSAIQALVDILYQLQHANWPEDPVLGATTLNIGTINGGVAANVIPAHAAADISLRVSTSVKVVEAQLREIIEKPRMEGIQVDFQLRTALDPVRCETVDVDGVDKFVAMYFTDIPYLHGGHSPLLFGPGSILVAHSVDEYVSKSDLTRSVEIIKDIVVQLVEKANCDYN
ncbi:hypothetical protein HDU85_001425 [Gaertneriomyces sp. JEL0708]|nr:hypothetical protein HDU85_001425 [Gaertneriomyces sp. JEL0708]